MLTPRIKSVTINYAQGLFDYDFLDGSARADLVFNDGTRDTFSWYHEEVSLVEADFLNHTMAEVREKFRRLDMTWLRS